MIDNEFIYNTLTEQDVLGVLKDNNNICKLYFDPRIYPPPINGKKNLPPFSEVYLIIQNIMFLQRHCVVEAAFDANVMVIHKEILLL